MTWFTPMIDRGLGFHQFDDEDDEDGYWCVACKRWLPAVDGVVVHDDIPHPVDMNFDDDETKH